MAKAKPVTETPAVVKPSEQPRAPVEGRPNPAPEVAGTNKPKAVTQVGETTIEDY